MSLLASTFKSTVSDQTTRDTDAFTIPSGAGVLHVLLMSPTARPPATMTWRNDAAGSVFNQTVSPLGGARTPPEGGPYSFFHYQLINPTAGTGFIRMTGVGIYDYARLVAGVYDGADGTVRGYKEVKNTGTTQITAIPAGNVAGDPMLMLFVDEDVYSSGHAPVAGTTQIGATDNRTLGLSKTSTASGDSLGVQFAGSVVAGYWGAVALVGAGQAAPSMLGSSPLTNSRVLGSALLG